MNAGSLRILGQIVLNREPVGHRPVGVDLQIANTAVEHWGAAVGSADDNPHAVLDSPGLHQGQLEPGDVDQDVAVAEVLRQPPPALHVDDDLVDPLIRRDVHRGDGFSAGGAVGVQAVAFLEAFDGHLQSGIEQRGVGAADGDVARHF